jgi:hypothetical protein
VGRVPSVSVKALPTTTCVVLDVPRGTNCGGFMKCTCGFSIGHPLSKKCTCKFPELTDDEIIEIAHKAYQKYKNWHYYQIEFAKAILEAASKK